MLELVTAGESHGPGIVGVLTGVPAGLAFDAEAVNRDLARRQSGYGRGERQKIERDAVEVLAGVRKGRTTGAPIALLVRNADTRLDEMPELYAPRPGHADLAGHQATGAPMRDVLERASARETAVRVAAGAVAKLLLSRFGVEVRSRVVSIGRAKSKTPTPESAGGFDAAEDSPVRSLDRESSEAMCREVDRAREAGDTVGGVFEVAAFGVPAGLGSFAGAQGRLDARLASALMSIPAVKGVEVGAGFAAALDQGSQVHDEIAHDPAKGARAGGYARETNRAGGIEGGFTNGAPVVCRAAMKPIPTLRKPLRSVDVRTRARADASKERSDVSAVAAASVVGEAAVALVLAGALLDRLGSGGVDELAGRFEAMLRRLWE